MGLTKHRIGELVSPVDERNRDSSIVSFFGININKEFMPTVANTATINARNYKVVRKGRFVFSGMQTGRDECIRIGFYDKDEPIVVSPAYTTFEVSSGDVVPEFFFMLFKRKEMDRLGWFLSDSSIRSNLDWERFCDIEIILPPLPIQQKYVAIYNAMLANQRSYEKGLESLNIVIVASIEKFKHTAPRVAVGTLLEETDTRNRDGSIINVKGININKEFMPSVANLVTTDLKKYKVINKNQFAANFMHVMRDGRIPMGLYSDEEPCIISPAYPVFQLKSEEALAEYIMLWFTRSETDRYAAFISDSSVRGGLELNRFYEMEIPLPSKEKQQALVNFYIAQNLIQQNITSVGTQLKELCPILIKGALQEATE